MSPMLAGIMHVDAVIPGNEPHNNVAAHASAA